MRHLPQVICVGAMMLLLVKAAQLPTTFLGPTDLLLSAQHDSMVKTDVKDLSALDPLPSTQKTVHTKYGISYTNKVTDNMPVQDRPKMVRVINGDVHTTEEEMVPSYNVNNVTQIQMRTTLECSNDTMPVAKISKERMILPFILDRVIHTETSGQHNIGTVTKTDQNIGKHLVNVTAILEESHLNVAHKYDVQSSDSHSISSTPDTVGSTPLQVSPKSPHGDPQAEKDNLHYTFTWNSEATHLNGTYFKVNNIWKQTGRSRINQLSDQIQNSEPFKGAAHTFKALQEKTHAANNPPNPEEPVLNTLNNSLSAWTWAMSANSTVHMMRTQTNSDLHGNDSILNIRFNPYSLPVEAKVTPVLKDNPAVGGDVHEHQNSPTTADTQQAQDLKPFGNSRSIRSAIPSAADKRIISIITLWPIAKTTQIPPIISQNPDTSNHRSVSAADALKNPEIGFIPTHRPLENPVIDHRPNDQPVTYPEPCQNPDAHPETATNPIAVHKPVANPVVVPRPIPNPIAVPRPIANPIAVPRPVAANPTAVPRPSAISMLVSRPVTNTFTIQKINGVQKIVYNPSLGFNSQSYESSEDEIYSNGSKEDESYSSESNEDGIFPLPLSLLYKK